MVYSWESLENRMKGGLIKVTGKKVNWWHTALTDYTLKRT